MQVKAFSVSGLVVGYPFGKLNNVEDVSFFLFPLNCEVLFLFISTYNRKGLFNLEQVVTVNLFIEELRKTEKLKDVKYTYWDERLSSKVYFIQI